MEKWQALLKFENAIARVNTANDKVRLYERNLETSIGEDALNNAAHRDNWVAVRAESAELAVAALNVLMPQQVATL